MHSDAATVEDYLAALPEDRRGTVTALRDLVNAHLPAGYEEQMGSGMITWVVPLSVFADTYNKQPLQLVGLASQKNHVALYLMGLYADEGLEAWFREQYAAAGMRLDLGRSCLRLRRLDQVHTEAVARVVSAVTPEQYVVHYRAARSARG